MNPTEIVHHRFGYGPLAGLPIPERAPNEAKPYLLWQMDEFDPSPKILEPFTGSAQAVLDFFEYRNFVNKRRRLGGGKSKVREIRHDRINLLAKQVAARAQLAAYGRAPFGERLTHFWSNHFTASVVNGRVRLLAAPHEFAQIRPNVMGNFADLLEAAVLTPAVLFYLDQADAFGPNSAMMRRRVEKGKANPNASVIENLAREILELHTLGVNGGYEHKDIVELAKALTGWSVRRNSKPITGEVFSDGSVFLPRRHEPGVRQVLGKRYLEKGADQARAILRDLATHPSTANHIATKLARHFTADNPPESLVAKLEHAFLKTGGDLPSVYRALIDAPESWEPSPRKFRQPWEWVISMHRGLGLPIPQRRTMRNLLRDLGQTTWGPLAPTGYDDVAQAWAAPNAMMQRVNIANAYAAKMPDADPVRLAQGWFPESLSASTHTAITRADSQQQALALLLVSPEMMRR